MMGLFVPLVPRMVSFIFLIATWYKPFDFVRYTTHRAGLRPA